jgi:hypothetical protein
MQGQSSDSLWGNKNKQGLSFGEYNLQGAWTREINGAEFFTSAFRSKHSDEKRRRSELGVMVVGIICETRREVVQ